MTIAPCEEWKLKKEHESFLGLCLTHTRETEVAWLVMLLILAMMILVLVPCTYGILRREYRRSKLKKRKAVKEAIIAVHEAAKKLEASVPITNLQPAMVTTSAQLSTTPHSCGTDCGGAKSKRWSENRSGTGVTILQMPVPMQMGPYEPWGPQSIYGSTRTLRRSSRIQSVDDLGPNSATLTRAERVQRLEPLPLPAPQEESESE